MKEADVGDEPSGSVATGTRWSERIITRLGKANKGKHNNKTLNAEPDGELDDESNNSTTAGARWPGKILTRLSDTYSRIPILTRRNAPYIYTPLPYDDAQDNSQYDEPSSTTPGTDEPKQLFTRLLTIHQGEFEDDIAVELDIVDIRVVVAARQEYDALSYVWGSGDRPYIVYVGKKRRTIPITVNLDKALRHLRYTDRPRHMWIDGLCIDQGNIEERSRQVSYMSHIYWTAPRVVVWLGPSADDSDYALETLHDIGSRIQVDWVTNRVTGVTELDQKQWGNDATILPLSDKPFRAILALTNRPWFERIWIRQEVIEATDHSLVVCGSKTIEWGTLKRGMYCCYERAPPPDIDWGTQEEWELRRSSVYNVFFPPRYFIKGLREATEGALCTDPRDYIYGLLGMLNDREQDLGIVPDYLDSNTAPELYKRITLGYIMRFKNLGLLESCGWDPPNARSSIANDAIPTWVPNWSLPAAKPAFLGPPQIIKPFVSGAVFPEDGVLRTRGLSLGVIQDLNKLDLSTFKGLAASIRTLVPHDALDTPYPGGGNIWDAFRITLCANMFYDRAESPESDFNKASTTWVSIEDSKEALKRIMAADPREYGNFLAMTWHWNKDCQLFTTREGYLGLGPKTIDKGDQIVSFMGCGLPIVVRPSFSTGERCFKVIGACYLHGHMFGEAFLGPLPEEIRPLFHKMDTGAYCFRFHNARTGDITYTDPRVMALPVDLDEYERTSSQDVTWQMAVRPETWRSWGIEVVDFDLV